MMSELLNCITVCLDIFLSAKHKVNYHKQCRFSDGIRSEIVPDYRI